MKGGNIGHVNLSSMKKRSWQPHKSFGNDITLLYETHYTSPHVYHAQWTQLHAFRTAVVISLRGIGNLSVDTISFFLTIVVATVIRLQVTFKSDELKYLSWILTLTGG